MGLPLHWSSLVCSPLRRGTTRITEVEKLRPGSPYGVPWRKTLPSSVSGHSSNELVTLHGRAKRGEVRRGRSRYESW